MFLTVISKDGVITKAEKDGIGYLRVQEVVTKAASYKDITKKTKELFAKKGINFTMPSSMKDLDAFYETWNYDELNELIKLSDEEQEIIDKYTPMVYFGYVYSLKVWSKFNESIGIRSNLNVLYGGIQISSNNMPQGELIQIPLKRNIGRQNQVHFVIHFNNCSADLGRKGFQREIVDFCKDVSRKLVDGPLQKLSHCLKQNTGSAPDLKREKALDDWKDEMIKHEKEAPLVLIHTAFFLPLRKISLTSIPTREQDVIALFNQLLAGGVIRGIRIMATNERLTYDGLYRVMLEEPREHHLYDEETNPLGVSCEVIDEFSAFISNPKVLEYKFSLDGLIEDLENGVKNSNDIGLVIVWETGTMYEGNYKITTLLDRNNISLRQYHGITHVMTNLNTGQREMDLIVLKELIDFLNDPESAEINQIEKYEES